MANEYSYRILYDDCEGNPRERDNNIGILLFYPDLVLESEINLYDIPNEVDVIMMLPLYFYAQNGMKYSIKFENIDDGLWSGKTAGFVLVARQQVEKVCGKFEDTPEFRAELLKKVEWEIKELNAYINGDCYGYEIFEGSDDSGQLLAHEGGFLSYGNAEINAREEIDSFIENPIQPTLFELEPIINKLDDLW